jgi:hypothetical protein
MPSKKKKVNYISINFLDDGSVKSIYYDEFFGINDSNNLKVERITDVEFDNATQKWVARLISTGEIISTHKLRNKVLADEVRAASKMLFNGIEIQPSKIKKNEDKKTKKNKSNKKVKHSGCTAARNKSK